MPRSYRSASRPTRADHASKPGRRATDTLRQPAPATRTVPPIVLTYRAPAAIQQMPGGVMSPIAAKSGSPHSRHESAALGDPGSPALIPGAGAASVGRPRPPAPVRRLGGGFAPAAQITRRLVAVADRDRPDRMELCRNAERCPVGADP